MPIAAASPKSCTASETIATLPVTIPPTASKTEKNRLSINAMNIPLSLFITAPLDIRFLLIYNEADNEQLVRLYNILKIRQ